MIIQGSNNPIVIQFDTSVADIPVLIVSLWGGSAAHTSKPLKKWEKADMVVDDDTVACEITERETAAFSGTLTLEAKGLDGNGNTIFWDSQLISVKQRRDNVIMMTQG